MRRLARAVLVLVVAFVAGLWAFREWRALSWARPSRPSRHSPSCWGGRQADRRVLWLGVARHPTAVSTAEGGGAAARIADVPPLPRAEGVWLAAFAARRHFPVA